MITIARAPYVAAYAANAAPALPAVGTARVVAPRAQAIGTATAMPRALNVRVGLSPSSLTYSAPIFRRATRPPEPMRSSRRRGVPPSPRDRISAGSRGRSGAYRQRSFLGNKSWVRRSFQSYRAKSGEPQSHVLSNRTGWRFAHAVHSRKAGRTPRSSRRGPYALSRDGFIRDAAFDRFDGDRGSLVRPARCA